MLIVVLVCAIVARSSASHEAISHSDSDVEPIFRMNIFNELELLRNWDNLPEIRDLSHPCSNELYRYLISLKNSTAWALRVHDASGHYGSGLFWGNEYWLGSLTLCKQLDQSHADYQLNNFNGTTPAVIEIPQFLITYEKRRIYKTNPYDKFTYPPFRLAFNTLFYQLNISDDQTQEVFYITQGLCLPKSCHKNDVQIIFTQTGHIKKNKLGRDIKLLQVRQLNTDNYSVWDDPVFHTLSIITTVICIMAVIGTIIDVFQLNIGNMVENEINLDHNLKIKFKHTDADKEYSLSTKIFLAFSFKSNLAKICAFDIGDGTLAPIHGLRLFSFLWVLMVHTCLVVFQMSDNKRLRNEFEGDVLYQTISNATFSVDTFFYMSGALVSFLFYRTMSKFTARELTHTNGLRAEIVMYISMVVYRFIRLTPPYLVVIALAGIAGKQQENDSVIQLANMDHYNCENYWWRNILYVNTLYPAEQMCMIWSWYLSDDSQFYVIGILILLTSLRHKKTAIAATVLLILSSWVTTAIVTIQTNYIPNAADPFSHYDEIYDKPWPRLGPYFIGLISGYVLNELNCKMPRLHQVVQFCGWVGSISVGVFVMYGLHYIEVDLYMSAVYVTFSHTLWALAVAWVLFVCVSGHGGWIGSILSWKYLYGLSRLVYCAYLIHPVIIKHILLQVESPLHVSKEVMIVYFFGFLIICFAGSLVLSLLFEAPVVSLLHLIHPVKPEEPETTEAIARLTGKCNLIGIKKIESH